MSLRLIQPRGGAALVLAALLMFPLMAQAQMCNCTCDATVPACYGISTIYMNESGGAPENPFPYLTAGIGTVPPTSAEVRHANRFQIAPGTTITHLCIALKNPSGPAMQACASGDGAYIFIAAHDPVTGLPGAIILGTQTPFTVDPCIGLAVNHQLVAFNTPQQFPFGGDVWFGVGYPTADVGIGHQGNRTRTGGQSAVWIGGTLSQWYNYEDPQLAAYNGRAPIIRALELVRGNGRLDVFPTVALQTDENGLIAQFDVHLAPAPPLANVTVMLSSTDPAEGQPLTTMLTFTPLDYNVPRTVSVLGQDDPIIDGSQPYEVVLQATSQDPCYDGARERTSLVNHDNDAPCQLRWTNIGTPAGMAAREGAAMAFDPLRNRVVLFGGRDSHGLPLADTWEFDVANNAWVQISPPPGPAPRWLHAMAFDPAIGQVVLTGGDDTVGTTFLETWAWNGAAWTPRLDWPSLVPTYHHAMCPNLPAGNMVMMGGEGPGGLALFDVHESTPAGWSPGVFMGAPAGPDPRGALAAAATSMGPVMFGGLHQAPGIMHGDTWMYIPGGWQQVLPPTSPVARHQHAMASFSARPENVVLFGGQDTGGTFLSDTWLFDASLMDWGQQLIAGPSARMLHCMAEIESQGRVLLFGGRAPGNVMGDTWILEDSVTLTVSGPPDATVDVQNLLSMTLNYVGSPPLQFQWHFNGAPLADGPTVVGSQTDTLTIGPATLAMEGDYWCDVTDACGHTVTGTIAFVDVLCRADFNGDGVVSVPDIFTFLAAWFAMSADADFDLDGVITVPDIFAFLAAWFAGC